MLRFTSHESARQLPQDLRTIFEEYSNGIVGYNARYKELHREHLARSRMALKHATDAAVERAAPGADLRALLLAPGPCFDTPLSYITQRFDQVTMADIHTAHTVAAVKRLPPELQDKIHIVEADLTGMVAKFDATLRGLGAMPTYEAFSEAAVPVLRDMAAEIVTAPPKLGNGYQLVSSHLDNSQFANAPVVAVEAHTQPAYGESLKNDLAQRTDLERTIFGLKGFVRLAHIAYLADAVGDQGVLHYADTYLPQELTTIGARMESALRQRFNPIGELQQWDWQITPDREYIVAGGAFTPLDRE